MKLLIVLSAVLIFLALPVLAFAEETEQEEEITLTTYYPAPYGDYTELTVDTLYLFPRDGAPTAWDASGHSGAPGELAYAEGDGKLYYSNGSAWVTSGGGYGGASFTYYCNFAGGAVPTNICADAGGTQGFCPFGFKQIYDLGSWGYCGYPDTRGFSHFRPAGAGCGSGWTVRTYGEAFVCSQ